MVGTTHGHHYGVLTIFQLLYIPFHYQFLRYICDRICKNHIKSFINSLPIHSYLQIGLETSMRFASYS